VLRGSMKLAGPSRTAPWRWPASRCRLAPAALATPTRWRDAACRRTAQRARRSAPHPIWTWPRSSAGLQLRRVLPPRAGGIGALAPRGRCGPACAAA